MKKQGILDCISVDCVLFGFENKELKVLLIRRIKEPAYGEWSLPGGVIYDNEEVDSAASRVLQELTGVKQPFLEQVHTFGNPNRFPGQRIVSILYYALIQPHGKELIPGKHASDTQWVSIDKLPSLPFDHAEMIKSAHKKLKLSLNLRPIGFELLPEKFPLNQLQLLYEAVLGKKIDNRNFRKKILKKGIVTKLNEQTKGLAQRPAYLYTLNKDFTDTDFL